MARSFETRVYLVRVLTDDRTSRLWLPLFIFRGRGALGPEGWSASPSQEQLTSAEMERLTLKQGQVHKIPRTIRLQLWNNHIGEGPEPQNATFLADAANDRRSFD
ncbi:MULTISPECIES: hypothetical protein [Bradyrhizobium]|uniref:hypothetical protein n=1 Tax=Bradyrhizobium TaxID=374 RepID=UPI00055CFEF4|nr:MULTISPECIES: hypothetical protein [Bradyrhizobium]UFW46543.1 hypothetical protein BaraCB756_30185 [Bradyrhizobium arachidis]